MSRLEDVAKRLGVSLMTVSRVVNNKNNVKDETRVRVLEAIKDLKYYPNAMGRALTNSKVQTIGVLGPGQGVSYENPYYAEIIAGIEKTCILHRYDVLLSTYRLKESEIDYLKLFREKKIDGIILVVPDMSSPQMEEIISERLPVIIVGERAENETLCTIDTDNEQAGKQATEYLIRMGHKKIAFVHGPESNSNAQKRLDGYLTVLRENNIEINQDWLQAGDLLYTSGREAMQRLLALKNRPTAVICANDLMALGVIAEASSSGLKIPDDLSVLGFDGIPAGRFIHPNLATFRQPLTEMGSLAASWLFDMLEKPDFTPRSKIFPLELWTGGSVKELGH